MAWCPICKNTFEDDNTCPDCSVELLDGIADEYTEVFAFSNEETTLNIFNHLVEIGVNSENVHYYYDENNHTYYIVCLKDISEKVTKQIIFYFSENPPKELSSKEQTELQEYLGNLINIPADESPKSYVSAEEKYENVNSSAISLLFVGAVGLALILIDITGIYRFPFSGLSRGLFIGTMGVLFTIFFIMGIYSLKKARSLAKEITSEEDYEEKITDYIKNTLDLSSIENDFDDETSPEVKCLTRVNYINEHTKREFPSVDESFIDYIIENLYDELYPDEF